jgi:hypothetical protein
MESDDPAGDDIGDDDGEDSSTSISITKLPCPPSLASSAPKLPQTLAAHDDNGKVDWRGR